MLQNHMSGWNGGLGPTSDTLLIILLTSLPRLRRLETSLATIFHGYYIMELFQQGNKCQNPSDGSALLGNLTHSDIENGTYIEVESMESSRDGFMRGFIQLPSMTHFAMCGWGIVTSSPELNFKHTSRLVHLELRRSAVDCDTLQRLLGGCSSLKTFIYGRFRSEINDESESRPTLAISRAFKHISKSLQSLWLEARGHDSSSSMS